MKKRSLRKILSCVLAVMMVVGVICPAAAATQVSPRGLVCMKCGGNCGVVFEPPSYDKNNILDSGSCEFTHYKATKVTKWRCLSCGEFGPVRETKYGHYCTGKGGHNCWDGECACKD